MKLTKFDALYAAQELFPKAGNPIEMRDCYGHQVFLLDTNSYPKRIIVKFGNQNKDKYSLSKEAHVMNLLRERGVPVPTVIFHDISKSRLHHEFMILSYIEGVDLEKIFKKLSKKDISSIAFQLGEILGRIHSIKFDEYGYINSKGLDVESTFNLKHFGRTKPFDNCIRYTLENSLHDLGSLLSLEGFPIEKFNKLYSYIVVNRNLIREKESPSLIHGDFDLRNIRVNETEDGWVVTGILDFELSASHSREYDFIKLKRFGLMNISEFKESLLKGYSNFQDIYEDFDDRVEYFRRGRDIGFAFVLFKSGEVDLANEVLEGLLSRIENE